MSTFVVVLGLLLSPSAAITVEERRLCHMGVRNKHGRMCHAYTTPRPRELAPGSPAPDTGYGTLESSCVYNTWWNVTKEINWGNCVNITTKIDSKDNQEYRYIISNSVPPYYFDPYCPFGLASQCANDTKDEYCGGYCITGEPCPFPTLKCGQSPSSGFTKLGDVWVAMVAYTKIPVEGNPTKSDRPGDMYSAVGNGEKTIQATTAVHLNGNSIQGPNDAGAINVDVAGFQLMCGGHVTPPVGGAVTDILDATDVPAMPPMYHYHKAPDCTPEFTNHSVPTDHGGTSKRHGLLFGYALDGFGLYGYEDIGGARPELDECGGHFGATDDDDLHTVLYHYHATTYSPYHLACQGPALRKCDSTQHGANFCGEGCGADVCVQPGTSKADLKTYLSKWNSTWLDAYTTNIDNVVV